jgi:hypothetical protein
MLGDWDNIKAGHLDGLACFSLCAVLRCKPFDHIAKVENLLHPDSPAPLATAFTATARVEPDDRIAAICGATAAIDTSVREPPDRGL